MADERKDERGLEETGEKLGSMAGRMAGMMGDAAMNATGAIFDSMASMLGAWWSGNEARHAASSFSDADERACRDHFESSSGQRTGAAASYDSTRPLYHFGHVAGQNPEYRGRSFGAIEPELQRAWESTPAGRTRGWNEVRDYVGFSYQDRSRPGGSREESFGL